MEIKRQRIPIIQNFLLIRFCTMYFALTYHNYVFNKHFRKSNWNLRSTWTSLINNVLGFYLRPFLKRDITRIFNRSIQIFWSINLDTFWFNYSLISMYITAWGAVFIIITFCKCHYFVNSIIVHFLSTVDFSAKSYVMIDSIVDDDSC